VVIDSHPATQTLRAAEARQVDGNDTMLGRERRNISEPYRPCRGQSVHQHNNRTLPDIEVLNLPASEHDAVEVLLPRLRAPFEPVHSRAISHATTSPITTSFSGSLKIS